MRHFGCRTTLDIYTRAVDRQKREASLKVVELVLPLDLKKTAPIRTLGSRGDLKSGRATDSL
jgi:hypothetical protein